MDQNQGAAQDLQAGGSSLIHTHGSLCILKSLGLGEEVTTFLIFGDEVFLV